MPDTLPSPDLGGYTLYDPSDPFEDYVGPIGYRRQDHGVHCLMPTQERHANGGGALHGGVLLTFADYALCAAASFAASGGQMPGSFAMTLSLTVQFLAGGRIGPAIESMGEATRVTGRLAFVRGSVTQDGCRLATYSGVRRHVARDKAMARRNDNGLAVVPGGTRPAGPPADVPVLAGYAAIPRPSPFTDQLGPVFYRQTSAQVHVLQPMLNSGASFDGGMLMTFAHNALCTAITASTGNAPSTATFSAEFLAGSSIGAPLESTVGLARATRSLGFATGLVTQAGKNLLSYSAAVALEDRHRRLQRVFELGPFPWGGDTNTVSFATTDLTDPSRNPAASASARALFDVGNWDACRFSLPGGQSGNPLSRHYDDLLPHWQAGTGVAIAWSPVAVEEASAEVLELAPRAADSTRGAAHRAARLATAIATHPSEARSSTWR